MAYHRSFYSRATNILITILFALLLAACASEENISCNDQGAGTETCSGQDIANVTLSWVAPAEREDGTPIALSEISSYRIYYGTAPNDYTKQLDIDDGSTVQLTMDNLPSGIYYFVLTTIDMEGRESLFSDMVTKSI